MNLLITSDLHLDLWTRTGRDPFAGILPVLRELDALIIAGDLASNPQLNWPQALARLRRLVSPAKVWVVPGNHDYYGAALDDDALARLAAAAGAELAQKRVLTFGNCRLLCCTLWTDFALTGDPEAAMARAEAAMQDYDQIRGADGKPISPEDTVAIYRDHLDWMTQEMARPWSGQTIIVTHHAPSMEAVDPLSADRAAFASDLAGWIHTYRPDYWFFGHTHMPLFTRTGGTALINVSLGYPSEVPEGAEAEALLCGLIFTGT